MDDTRANLIVAVEQWEGEDGPFERAGHGRRRARRAVPTDRRAAGR